MIMSSQELRNEYEKFYKYIRNYLWSFDALDVLAHVEDNIYTSFIDYAKLKSDLSKLYAYIKETCKEDENLQKSYDKLDELTSNGLDPEAQIYSVLNKVQEVNPEVDKVIKLNNPEDTEEEQ